MQEVTVRFGETQIAKVDARWANVSAGILRGTKRRVESN
jgi:hypothetical protein